MKAIGKRKRGALRVAACAALAGAAMTLTGCLDSPTYGTGVSANRQLAEDLSRIASVTPKKRDQIAYKPRPELVKPGAAELAETNLPEPQTKVATSGNPDWPESPEERRARIRADATANQDNPFYDPEVVMDSSDTPSARAAPIGTSQRAIDSGRVQTASAAKTREEFNRRLADQRQGSSTTRKYLSEPPLAYRQPADSAPQGDIGEDEWKKEKRLKDEARKKSGKKAGWFDWLPGT